MIELGVKLTNCTEMKNKYIELIKSNNTKTPNINDSKWKVINLEIKFMIFSVNLNCFYKMDNCFIIII